MKCCIGMSIVGPTLKVYTTIASDGSGYIYNFTLLRKNGLSLEIIELNITLLSVDGVL